MGIMSLIREQRRKVQERRVSKLRAGSGDRSAQLELVKEERKHLEEKEKLRREKEKVRELRFAPVKRFAAKAKKRAQVANKRILERTDKTASVFGGKSVSPFETSTKNPFFEEPKKEPSQRPVVVKISR